MSLEDKIKNAKPSDLLTDIPKWKAWFIVRWARFKAKIELFFEKRIKE